MASLEDQIRAIMESKAQAKEKADRVDEDPAVKIENPMDPNISSSEVDGGLTADQGESEEAEGTDGDANAREIAAKKKAEQVRKAVEEDAQENFDDAKKLADTVDATGDRHEDQFDAVQAVQNETDVDPSDADAMARFEAAKKKAEDEQVAVDSGKLEEMLGSEFSDDFKLKAKTLFEATVKQHMSTVNTKLEESSKAAIKLIEEEFATKTAALTTEFQERYDQRVKLLEEETSEKIDGYLTYVAEEWTTKNELALEAGIKTELTESFINKLKTLCEQHYIDLPEAKVDLYQKALDEKVELESSLLAATTQLQAIKEELNNSKRANIIEETSKEFSSLDASRFKTLVEDFEFEDEDTFKKKLGIVKTSFFENKQTGAKEHLNEALTKSEPISEKGPSTIEPLVEHTRMSAYVSALKQ